MPKDKNDFSCLEVKNVSKSYPQWVDNENSKSGNFGVLLKALFKKSDIKREKINLFYALKDISFSLKRYESLGVIGLNGSGKSTLMQIIAGTVSPSFGDVKVVGKVSALLELGSGFNPDFTGKENVIINGKILGLNENEVVLRLPRIKEFADIGEFFDQPVRTYSSGMVLRLAFAVITQINPDLLIIDEALAVGDARFQLKCYSFLEEFKKGGGSLILVSHDLNSVARLCDKAVLLKQGKLIKKGIPLDVINEYSKLLTFDDKIDKKNYQQCTSFIRKQVLVEETSESRLSNEFSYGGHYARITNIQLNSEDKKDIKVVKSGESFDISFTVVAYMKIEDPVFAMTIKDSKGQEVYGHNTLLAKIKTPDLEINGKIQIQFKQQCNLGAGDYFISIGVTRFEDEKLTVVHRRYDALELKVINTDGSFGVANCNSKIICKKLVVLDFKQ